MTKPDEIAAAEPPLDCRVGLREAVDEIMRHQFTHSQEAMSALQRLVDAAEAGACEIERLHKLLQQVLADAQAQDVLLEWWHALECETVPNAQYTP